LMYATSPSADLPCGDEVAAENGVGITSPAVARGSNP
jgi:hypothetical protein